MAARRALRVRGEAVRAVFYRSGNVVVGCLLGYSLWAEGITLEEAVKNLQIAIGGRLVTCHEAGVEHVFEPVPIPAELQERYDDGQALFYTKLQFVFEGKVVEIPNLSIHVWEPWA